MRPNHHFWVLCRMPQSSNFAPAFEEEPYKGEWLSVLDIARELTECIHFNQLNRQRMKEKKYPGKALGAILIVLLLMPLGHALMILMEHFLTPTALHYSAFAMGFIMIPPFSRPCKQTPVILIFSAKHSPALSYFPDIVISGRQQQ